MKVLTQLLVFWLTLTTVLANLLKTDNFEHDTSPKGYQEVFLLRQLALEFVDFYQNITIKDLVNDETNLRPLTEQDLECFSDIDLLTKGLGSGSIWAMRMIDSWGSVPSGILYGNRKDLGNYDECVNIQHMVSSSHILRGKYCFADVPIGSFLRGMKSLNAKTAVCFPSSCSAANMDTLIRRLIQHLLNKEISPYLEFVTESSCRTAERNLFDGVTIFSIVILSILSCIVLLATIFDYLVSKEQVPPLVRAFSARANSRSLFRIADGKSNPNVIDCLHGLRCLSLIWVILYHEHIISSNLPHQNLVDIYAWSKTAFSNIFRQGTFAVGTFFFITGLLLVAGGLRTMEKSMGKLNVPMMYLHRYLRLTPVLALAILIYMKILPLMGDGPLFLGFLENYTANCQRTWFWTLLYVQNYATTDVCLSHTWYLAADMQLYLVSVLLLIALHKWGEMAAAGIVLLILLLSTFFFCEISIFHHSIHDRSTYQRVYYATHTQASPFFIGLLFGYFLHLNRGKAFKLNRLVVWLGWLIGLGLIFTCVFATSGYDGITKSLPHLEEAFHLSLGRIAWALGLSWIVFACMQGYGGPINSFLSSPLWQPLSKLSYCTYIFHMFFVLLNMGITRTSTTFSNYNLLLRFWGDFGFSILFSYVMYILIEVPFGNLETFWLPIRRKISFKENTKDTKFSHADIRIPLQPSTIQLENCT